MDSLTDKGYLVLEHPKQKIGGQRIKDESLPKGYNIVSGKKSFEINKILDPNDVAPTLVAMDMEHLFVVDNGGLRTLTGKEGLLIFRYDYSFDFAKKKRFILLGYNFSGPVIKAVSIRNIHPYLIYRDKMIKITFQTIYIMFLSVEKIFFLAVYSIFFFCAVDIFFIQKNVLWNIF
ncbi:hypothetical protein ACVWQR_00520 [Neisseria meningitidis]